MYILKMALRILVYVVVVCPITEILCIEFARLHGALFTHGESVHIHQREKPCAVCPRHGRCVPKVQCPAHLRPGSYNPECHLDSSESIGICCFTGYAHAAESDHKLRSSTAVSTHDVKAAHHHAHQKLHQWTSKAVKLLEFPHKTLVNVTAPSFAHHLSMVTYDKNTETLGRGGLLNLFTAQELKARQAITNNELTLGLTDQVDGPYCPAPPMCPKVPSRYRLITGECNNPAFPSWGAVNTGIERLLPPDYSDGFWAMRVSSSGLPLPSARAVSSALLPAANHPSGAYNLLLMQFGQFIVHDVSAGVVFTAGNGSAISCCINNGEDFLPPELQHWACAPIAIDPNDSFYSQFGQTCHNFVRTQLAPSSDCSIGYARQMNGATHYPDLSHLYGSTPEKVALLRGPGGLLNTFNDFGRDLPPLTTRQECLTVREGSACFESGDDHANQIISLTAFHTIWTREHNRVARALTRLNPMWNEDVIFSETRRILQGQFQHIVYNEWLPLVLGPEIIQLFDLAPSEGYSSSYDAHVNPSLLAEFSTAAMRFGHSTVDSKFVVPNPRAGDIYESLWIPEVMFQPGRMRLKYFMDRLLTGLVWQPMQSVDPFLTDGLTRYLFRGGNPFGLDLASINIQRGRDWGLRPYNAYRRLVGLPPYTDFAQFAPSTDQRLSSVYSSPEDIDLWVGGLLEEPVEGGLVGPTFAHIIADQFSRFKKGDRHFYEYGPDVNPGGFSPSQLLEIKKSTFSRIICDNRDGIDLFSQPPNAFFRADLAGNEAVPCDSNRIPEIDLSRFKEI